jgi:cyclase
MMRRTRVIPCLCLQGGGLVKTRKFKDPVYIGDPVNAVKIFSDKEADEICVLDIAASRSGKEPDYELLAEMAGEAFMPMSYGGGISNVAQIRRLIRCGIEKIVVNSYSVNNLQWLQEAVQVFGSQAIVGCLDVKKTLFGSYRLMTHSATKEGKVELDLHIKKLVDAGVGEIFINSIDRDGTMSGYDLPLLQQIVNSVTVPVVICGGAGTTDDLKEAVRHGASGVAAGSMFVFHGKHRAVLISYSNSVSV